MHLAWILLIPAAVITAVVIASYICFRIAFFSPDRKPLPEDLIETPEGAIYDPYRSKMEQWSRETRQLPQEKVQITSFDGLTLHGTYYEYAPGAPIEIMFHGYRGTPQRDLSGGVQRCFQLGRSALLVYQRCAGISDGNVITFGIQEHRDCLSWVDFAIEKFGPDVKLILTGISMGAATVLTAAGHSLPKNVLGVLADCGFSSPKEILCDVMEKMGFPSRLCYPFVRLGARIFGKFDPEETSALEAMKTCTVPVLLFHGEDDAFVPCDMSRKVYDACPSRKMLVTVPGAGHGLSYPVDPQRYLEIAGSFFAEDPADLSV